MKKDVSRTPEQDNLTDECRVPFVLNPVYSERLHTISAKFNISNRRALQGSLKHAYGLDSITTRFCVRNSETCATNMFLEFTSSQLAELKRKQHEEGCVSVAELCRKAIDITLHKISSSNFKICRGATIYFEGITSRDQTNKSDLEAVK